MGSTSAPGTHQNAICSPAQACAGRAEVTQALRGMVMLPLNFDSETHSWKGSARSFPKPDCRRTARGQGEEEMRRREAARRLGPPPPPSLLLPPPRESDVTLQPHVSPGVQVRLFPAWPGLTWGPQAKAGGSQRGHSPSLGIRGPGSCLSCPSLRQRGR